MIAVLSAMEDELKDAVDVLKKAGMEEKEVPGGATKLSCEDPRGEAISYPRVSRSLAFGRFYSQNGREEDICMAAVGVGKVVSALGVMEIIVRFSPRVILFSGISGALTTEIDIGDILIGRDLVQWDMDVSALGIKPGVVPFISTEAQGEGKSHRGDKSGLVKCDSYLVKTARETAENYTKREFDPGGRGIKVQTGRIASADTFLGKKSKNKKLSIAKLFEADVVDMEGWSIAYTAVQSDIPFLVMRVVSDTLEGKKPPRIRQFIKESSVKCGEIFLSVIRQLLNY